MSALAGKKKWPIAKKCLSEQKYMHMKKQQILHALGCVTKNPKQNK